MSLVQQAILMRCTISQWDATVRDNDALKSFLTQEQMAADAGTLNKHLIAKSALKGISDAAKKIRDYHRKLTMPWNLDGVGLLMNDKILDYMTGMRPLKEAFEETVDQFINHYEIYTSDSKLRLGHRYNALEFPSLSQLKLKFGVDISPLPIPQSGHILTDLTDTGIDASEVDKAVKAAENKALMRLWQQVYVRLKLLHERLSDTESRFKATTIEKLEEFITKLQDFNIYQSSELEAFVQFIRIHITNQEASEIRKFPEVRTALLNHLEQAITACKPYIGDIHGIRSIEESD
jgi:hypothetical protein